MRLRELGVALVVAAAAVLPAESRAQDVGDREARWEFFVQGGYLLGDDAEATDAGLTDIEVEEAFAYGLGLGFNVHQNVSLYGQFFHSASDVTAQMGATALEDDLRLTILELNADWYIFDGTFTPFITGGGGAAFLDSDVIDETDLSYNAGGGVRWDLAEHQYLKLLYRHRWIDEGDLDDPLELDEIGVVFGVLF